MRQLSPFKIGERSEWETRQSSFEGERNGETIGCCDPLVSSDDGRAIIHNAVEVLQLWRRENGCSFVSVDKLIEDEDDRSLVCVGDTSCSDNRKVAQLVAINALCIHLVSSGGDDTNIIASNASIGTSINKSMVLNEALSRGLMGNVVNKDLTKDVVLRLETLGCHSIWLQGGTVA